MDCSDDLKLVKVDVICFRHVVIKMMQVLKSRSFRGSTLPAVQHYLIKGVGAFCRLWHMVTHLNTFCYLAISHTKEWLASVSEEFH